MVVCYFFELWLPFSNKKRGDVTSCCVLVASRCGIFTFVNGIMTAKGNKIMKEKNRNSNPIILVEQNFMFKPKS